MFRLQDMFNENTNGPQWKTGVTLEGRTINWDRCIYMEAAEAIDSLNYKHWKSLNQPEDIENVKIELVDIWHFIMSREIALYGEDPNWGRIASKWAFSEYEEFNKGKITTTKLIDALDSILVRAANGSDAIVEFFAAVEAIEDFTMDDVYILYIGKNCLNQFRQDNGYKEGTYVKIWNHEEDNVHMQRIMNNKPDTTYDELYVALNEIYVDVKGE